jgi:predicted lipid-binding transport protein (Tim44 family)
MNNIPIDILIFAIIAALIFYRYISILGATDDEDSQRKNRHSDHLAKVIIFPSNKEDIEQNNSSNSLEEILNIIEKKDQDFDRETFIQGSKTAFTLIVAAFTKGDMSCVSKLISPPVMRKFKSAIKERESNIELHLDQITHAEITQASLNASNAEIIVQFTSIQTLLQNGKSDGTEEVIDLWTFSRNIYSQDPTWLLLEISPAVSDSSKRV